MHFLARLGLASLVLASAAFAQQTAEDIAKFGVTVPTTGLVPVVVEDQELSALDRDFAVNPDKIEVDLRPRFTVAGLLGEGHALIQFQTSLGTFNAELLADGTDAGAEDLDPHITVNNFKSYLATDATAAALRGKSYDSVFVHRVDNLGTTATPRRILQTGGYRIANGGLSSITRKAAIVREARYANTRGTIAMARTSEPNSATSEWFVNLDDNTPIFNAGDPASTTDDNTYAVFARVLGNGMSVVDRIHALPTPPDNSSIAQFFWPTPLRNWSSGQPILLPNLVYLDAVRVVPLQPTGVAKSRSVLTYSVINDNPSAATASVNSAGRLVVTKGKRGGRALLTVRASEAGGAYVDSVLTVTHPGAPFIVKQLPGVTTAALGTTLTLTADITAWPLDIKWQRRAPGVSAWEDIAENDARFSGSRTEYLTIKLTGADPAAVGQALALANSQFRFVLANDLASESGPKKEGNPTKLVVTTKLAFAKKLAGATTAALGSSFTLSAPVAAGVYPAPTYQWERLAPGSATWEPLINSVAAVKGNGTDAAPEFPAVPSPYSGVTTSTLTVRLTGPETPAANSTAISTLQTLALHQSKYRCVLRHDRGAGPVAVETNPTTLRITTVPVGVAAQPAKAISVVVPTAAGQTSTVTLSVAAKPAASNTPVKYQWQKLNPVTKAWDNLVNYVAPTAASGETPANPGTPSSYQNVTTATLTIRVPHADILTEGFGLSLDGAQYRCVLTNVLNQASAPFGPAAGIATSATSTLRVFARRASLVTAEDFRLDGLDAADLGVRTFSAKGLPKGLSIDPQTGRITGVPLAPGAYKVVITVRDHDVIVATRAYSIEVVALGGNSAGSYEALLSPDFYQPPIAKVLLTVTGTGVFSGQLYTTEEKSPLPLRGAVVRDPATGVLHLKQPVVVSRPGAPAKRSYILDHLAITTDGRVTVFLFSRSAPDATPVEIAFAYYIADTAEEGYPDGYPGNPGVRLATYTKANPAPWAYVGAYNFRYTLAFTSPTPLDSEATEDAAAFPPTGGYATGTTSPDGKLSLRGKLGDGTILTATLPGDLDGDFRLFLRPYNVNGAYFSAFLDLSPRYSYTTSFFGFYRYSVAYDLGNEDPEDDYDDGLQTYWHRPAGSAKPAAYSAGFAPLGLSVRMEPWFVSAEEDLGMASAGDRSHGTVQLGLTAPDIDNAAPNPRALPTKLKMTYSGLALSSAVSPDASGFTGKVNPVTGVFSGTFKLEDEVSGKIVKRTVPYEGVFLVPHEVNEIDWTSFQLKSVPAGKITGEGLFLPPALPGAAPVTGRIHTQKAAE